MDNKKLENKSDNKKLENKTVTRKVIKTFCGIAEGTSLVLTERDYKHLLAKGYVKK